MAPGFQTFVSCQQQLVPNAMPIAHKPHFHTVCACLCDSYTNAFKLGHFSPGENQRRAYRQYRVKGNVGFFVLMYTIKIKLKV